MRYPTELTEPMREELITMGVEELRTPEAVDELLQSQKGTVLVFVNSVCGCAAGTARPGLALALQHAIRPDAVTTVFAGVDLEATARARSYFNDYPPSSPQVALFRDGRLAHLMQRHQIEGRTAQEVAGDLMAAFEKHCGAGV